MLHIARKRENQRSKGAATSFAWSVRAEILAFYERKTWTEE